MKTQKILRDLEKDSQALLTKKLILSQLGDLKKIKNKIAENESVLCREIKKIILNDHKLKELESFFHLEVYFNKSSSDDWDTLLNIICSLISKSLQRLYDTPKDESNALINYAGYHFSINHSEIRRRLKIHTDTDLSDLFNMFNEMMNPYDVWVKVFNNVNINNEVYLLIHLRILK